MSYLDVISLEDAKVYLRIDDDLTEDDSQIRRMIKGALHYVENYTNHILYARNKEYRLIDGEVSVYDHPINSEVTADLTVEYKTLHTNYTLGTSNDLISLNVGYVDCDDIPEALVEVAYVILDLFYYGKEAGKTTNDLSDFDKHILNDFKRFIL